MKLYGFTSELINNYISSISSDPILNIVYFSNILKLSYDVEDESLKLLLNNIVQFQFDGFSKKIATWVPISIAAFRGLTIQKDFNSMTLGSTPLKHIPSSYSKLYFRTIRFSKYMIGHISDITIYDTFIINALGYASHKDNINSIFRKNYGLDIILFSFPLKSTIISDKENEDETINSWSSSGHCLNDIPINDNNGFSNILTRTKCVEDYITYTDQNCNDEQFVKYNTENYPPTCVDNPSKCDDITQVIQKMDVTCDYLIATCDNKSINSINNLIFSYITDNNEKYIICGSANGLEIARFKPNSVHNILSPTDEFKMEFWFLSQSYINNNFGTLEIKWNGHVDIIIQYSSSVYSAKCYGLDSTSNQVSFSYTGNEDNKWRYVVCGVSISKNEIYVTNLQKENQIAGYKRNLVNLNIPSSSLTDLYISESSPTNFGVTYIKELRLWKCYECYPDKAFVIFNRDDPFFSDVLHYFKFEDPGGVLKDYRNNIYTGDENIKVQFETKDEFNGYGLLNSIPDAPNCNEQGSMYYSLKLDKGCDILFNFNIFKTDIIFNDIPASRTNRYTMDFWFYVESADDFQKGFNIIFEDHMTISSFAGSTSDNDITVYCFPQGYRNNMMNIFGNDILNKFNVEQNKISDVYINGYSKWNYVRCAYSFDSQNYYLNNKPEEDVKSEIYFWNPSQKRNEKGFKMFMKNLVKLIINVSRDNFTRIFIQTINIFREYIPQSIDTKYIKMKEYIFSVSNNYYYPILFSVDFSNDYDIITNRLKYYITDYDWIPETEQYLENFMTNIFSRSYPTYPIYEPFLECGVGKIYNLDLNNLPYCEYITTPDNCNNENTFCINNNQFFWCPEGKYLDINTLSCNDDCPIGYTRPSDVINGYGMCNININHLHYLNYPKNKEDLAVGVYENKFECQNLYSLINYHCIQDTSDTAIYFSNKYSFTNTIATFNSLYINNYYVDFWIMFDLSESYRYSNDVIENDENRYYIFIAFPHIITRYKRKIQYSNSYIINKFTDIISIDELLNKWNHIVLENYVIIGENLATTFKYINIYINNNYEESKMSLKINNDNDFSIAQIAFCSGKNDKWSSCTVGLSGNYKIFKDIIWEDAFYKQIIVWNRDSTNIASINTFGTPLNNDITMNIVAYYPFTIDTIISGYIKSRVTYRNVNLDFEFKYNTENQYDHSQQVNWVNNFDITISSSTTSDNYIESIDNSYYTGKDNIPYFSGEENTYVTNPCSDNCYKCFSDGSNKCISCKSGFILSGSKCINPTKYYFNTPVQNGNTNPITFKYDLTQHDEITIMIYMKFLGSVAIRDGIVPLIYFYDQDNYLGWDNDNNQFIIEYKIDGVNKIPFKYSNSRVSIGKWALYSISIYNSNYQGKFPNMIQFMIDDVSIPNSMELSELNLDTILYNKISLSNTVSALYYDLRIYDKFYIGAYSLGQEFDTTFPSLKYYLKLNSISTGNGCLDQNDVETSLISTNYCIGDDNMYDDSDYQCVDNGNQQFRIINSVSHSVSCNNCNEYCDSKCYDINEQGCLCTYDSKKYILRYIKSAKVDDGEKMFYCQKPYILNLNEFNNINIGYISLGSSTSYQIEFWFYVFSYISNSNFNGGIIEWWHYIKININKNSENDNYLDITCYPYSDENLNGIQDSTHKFDEWIFVRCIVDKDDLELKLNDFSQSITSELVEYWNFNQPKFGSTVLRLKDNNSNIPYGLFLIRELRIWNSKTTLFYDTSHLNLATDSTYSNLAHYYKNIYQDNEDRQYMLDSKNNIKTTLNNSLIANYPYSYVPENFIDLVLCNEGDNYKLNVITGKYECSNYGSTDMLDSIKNDNSVLSSTDLYSKMKMLYNMAVNEYESPIDENEDFYSIVYVNNDGELAFTDSQISTTFCSNKGYVKIVDHTPTCYCYGDYVGKYCQLNKIDYSNIDEIFSIYFNKLKVTYSQYHTNPEDINNLLLTINDLIDGVNYYTYENSLITEITNWFSTMVIYKITTCDIEYIKLVNKLYRNNFDLTNYYKIGNMANGKGNSRNSELSYGQQSLVDSNAIELKRMLEYLSSLCFPNSVNNYWNYKSDDLNIDLIIVSGSFDIDSFLQEKKENIYYPYFKIGNCLNDVKKSTSGNLNVQFITWFNSPYYYNPDLYWNYTSHYISIKIYNDELSEVPINSCSDNNNIEFYFSLYNPIMVDIIQPNKIHFTKEYLFTSDDPIFTEPKYIDKNGKIDFSSRQERIDKYYFEYILEFNTLNAKTLSFNSDGLKYEDITDNYFFKCTSNHLSEFMLNYLYNPYPTKEDGRLFFLKHAKLYGNSENFKKNYGFFILLVILFLYILNFLICYFRNKKKLKDLDFKKIRFINLFLEEYVYPYGNIENEYIVNKETGNKIINEDYESKEENNLDFQEKIDKLSINKNKKKKSKKGKKNKKRNKVEEEFEEEEEPTMKKNKNINLGNVKSKKMFSSFFSSMKKAPEQNSNNDFQMETNAPMKTEENKNNSFFDATENETNVYNSKRKKSINKNFFIDDNDLNKNFKNQRKKEKNSYIHNLFISNENQRVKQLLEMKISCWKFFSANFINRNMFINTWKSNATYTQFSKSLFLPFYLQLMLFMNTFIYLFEKEELSFKKYISNHYIKFTLFCLLSIFVSNIYFYLKSIFYNIENGQMRTLLYNFKTDKNEFEPEYNKILKRIKIVSIIETVLFFILWAINYMFSFGLCCVYYHQGRIMAISFLVGIGLDFILDIIIELLIMVMYACRKNSICVVMLDRINRLKSFKMISP